jgi:hypothetical protein
MATKNQKLDSYIIRYHNLNEPAQYDMRVSVPRSYIRSVAKLLREKYQFVIVARVQSI